MSRPKKQNLSEHLMVTKITGQNMDSKGHFAVESHQSFKISTAYFYAVKNNNNNNKLS